MKATAKMCLFAVLLAATVGCQSSHVRMGPVPGKEYTVVGKGMGRSTGLMVMTFIPIIQNDRFQNAYTRAVKSRGGDDLVNPVISERWFWAYVLNGYSTTIEGDVIKYK